MGREGVNEERNPHPLVGKATLQQVHTSLS